MLSYQAEIYKCYTAHAIIVEGGEIFLHASVALSLIAECESRNVVILGFDTFRIDERGTLAFLDGIADFSPHKKKSWADYRSTCNRAAVEIIKQLGGPEPDGRMARKVPLDQLIEALIDIRETMTLRR